MKTSDKAALLAGGAVACGIGAVYLPRARPALILASIGLGGGAAYVAWQSWKASNPGDAGGLIGFIRDSFTGSAITAGDPILQRPPTIGGVQIEPGRVTLPSGQVIDAFDPTGSSPDRPVTGSFVTPAEGGSVERAAFAPDYLVQINVRNKTSTGITGVVRLELAETLPWPFQSRTTTAESQTIDLPAHSTLTVPIVARIASSSLNVIIYPGSDVYAVASFAGWHIADRHFSITS